jgi:hypothetical protein
MPSKTGRPAYSSDVTIQPTSRTVCYDWRTIAASRHVSELAVASVRSHDFSSERMVDDYARLFESVAARASRPIA